MSDDYGLSSRGSILVCCFRIALLLQNIYLKFTMKCKTQFIVHENTSQMIKIIKSTYMHAPFLLVSFSEFYLYFGKYVCYRRISHKFLSNSHGTLYLMHNAHNILNTKPRSMWFSHHLLVNSIITSSLFLEHNTFI